MKRALTSQPILIGVSELKPFIVVIDACSVGRGYGAILMQEGDNEVLHPVAYWSRGLSDARRRYSATELECTAMHNDDSNLKNVQENVLEILKEIAECNCGTMRIRQSRSSRSSCLLAASTDLA